VRRYRHASHRHNQGAAVFAAIAWSTT